MWIGCSLVLVASMIQTFAPNFDAYIAGRLVVGLGHGFCLCAGPVYVAEISPTKLRGAMLTMWELSFTIGAFFVYWTAYGMSGKSYLGIWQWRMVNLLQIVLPTIVIVGIALSPESPRWLVENGKLNKARQALGRVNPPDDVDGEFEAIVAAVNYERSVINKGDGWMTPYKVLWKDKSVRRRFLVSLWINAGQQACGNGQLNSYSTLIYQQVFSNSTQIFLINALASTFNILFVCNCIWLVDRFGRRKLLIFGALGQAAALCAVASIGVGTRVNEDGTRPFAVGVSVAFCFFVFAFFFKPSWGATVWIYSSEIFSLNVRAHAVSFTTTFQAVTSAILSQFFPIFLKNCGFYTFYFFCGINLIDGAFVYFFLPETKGVSLEDMDAVFGAKSHRLGGEALDDAAIAQAGGIRRKDVWMTEGVIDAENAEIGEKDEKDVVHHIELAQ